MIEYEQDASRKIEETYNRKRIRELEGWFKHDYVQRLLTINRYLYLGLEPPEKRYSLELEAYEKENELRLLKGKEPLPKLRFKDLI